MLVALFEANERFKNAGHIRYVDIPKYFTWNEADRQWKPRDKYKIRKSVLSQYDLTQPPQPILGRIYNISPREAERYFLRTLLLHRPGVTSFKDMIHVEGRKFSSYCEACCALGLLSDDAEWMRCLQNAFSSIFEPLTTVSATIIAHCEPSYPVVLREKDILDVLTYLRRRYAAIWETVNILDLDSVAVQYAMQEVQDALKDINVRLSL